MEQKVRRKRKNQCWTGVDPNPVNSPKEQQGAVAPLLWLSPRPPSGIALLYADKSGENIFLKINKMEINKLGKMKTVKKDTRKRFPFLGVWLARRPWVVSEGGGSEDLYRC